MTIFTRQEFYSTGTRGIVSRLLDGKSLGADCRVVLEADGQSLCRVGTDVTRYGDEEWLVETQGAGLPIEADGKCMASDGTSYTLGDVSSDGESATIGGTTKSLAAWRQSGTLFVQDTRRVWTSPTASAIVGVDEFEDMPSFQVAYMNFNGWNLNYMTVTPQPVYSNQDLSEAVLYDDSKTYTLEGIYAINDEIFANNKITEGGYDIGTDFFFGKDSYYVPANGLKLGKLTSMAMSNLNGLLVIRYTTAQIS